MWCAASPGTTIEALAFLAFVSLAPVAAAADLPDLKNQQPNTWVKRSPLEDGPVSPGMGYEASLGYDPRRRRVIRWGGHNQGGGGEQNAETWTFDPAHRRRGTLKEPNTSPPGVCCAQQNVFDPVGGRFLRFPAFSGSHGWQWFREIYLNNSSVWSLRPRRPTPGATCGPLPAPAPRPAALRRPGTATTRWPSSSAARANRRGRSSTTRTPTPGRG